MSNKPTVFNYQDYEKAQEEIRRLRKQLANAQIKNRIAAADVLEEVKEQICDGYCKWPVLYGAMDLHDELLDGPCKHCPLDRL